MRFTSLCGLALILGITGLLMSSGATVGVALIGLGCLAGILARLVQAERQHRELLEHARHERELLELLEEQGRLNREGVPRMVAQPPPTRQS